MILRSCQRFFTACRSRAGAEPFLRRLCWLSLVCCALAPGLAAPARAQTEPNVVEIETTSGEVFRGNVVELSEDGVLLELPYGLLSVPSSQIKRIERRTVAELEAEAGRPVWSSRIEGSLLTRQGVETELSVRIAGRTSRTTETSRTGLDGSYTYINSTERKDLNDGKAQFLQEWLDPNSPWSTFGTGIYEYDGFKSWRQRVSGYGGLGYDILDRDNLTLIGRLGTGARVDIEGSRNTDWEGLVNFQLTWQIREWQEVTFDNRYYHNLSNAKLYRNLTIAAYTIQVGTVKGLFLSLGAEYEYDRRDDVDNDIKIYTSLRYEF